MRRPAPESLSDIRHPGPVAEDRRPHASCLAEPVILELANGQPLLSALGNWAEREGFGSAVLDLGGLSLQPFNFVMPDRAIDDRHAAWYSDTHSSGGVALEEAVAILGWRDGNWFAHIHAYWYENGQARLGHLLPETLTIARSAQLKGFGLKGARFVAEPDPETEFTLFRVKQDQLSPSDLDHNAIITTLAPFEDMHESIAALADCLGDTTYDVFGLGSFAGAQFIDGQTMPGLISEILVRPGAGRGQNQNLNLPVRCVDLTGQIYEGTVKPAGAPTLVTCELLLLAQFTSQSVET
ncbi:hypothetical protein ABLO27_06240 [Roseibium sp. SCPC15]|uniref:hypothetical protein n=1 Tax=Roseibium sp. SCP15 TaxID=3141376 RepID=UPI00333A7EB8